MRSIGSNLILCVSDDGVGISERDLRRSDALGVVGMRERAQLFGGTVALEGSSGQGTVVTVTLPLKHSGTSSDVDFPVEEISRRDSDAVSGC